MDYIIINVPYNFKSVIWKNLNKNFINFNVISDNKVYKMFFDKKDLFFDKWSNSLIIKRDNYKNSNKISNKVNDFLKSWNLYFFKKIKFKGKGFRIKSFKKTKLIKFYFGKSHKTFIFLNKINKKRINKYKYLLTWTKKVNLNKIINMINKIKPMNMYTLRGLRSSRQIIYKRKGKKGTYI